MTHQEAERIFELCNKGYYILVNHMSPSGFAMLERSQVNDQILYTDDVCNEFPLTQESIQDIRIFQEVDPRIMKPGLEPET